MGGVILQNVLRSFGIKTYGYVGGYFVIGVILREQPGLIEICTSVHFLCDTVLRTLLHVSPQFQREMSTEWR